MHAGRVHCVLAELLVPLASGVEPWTYYFVNAFLNFNAVFLLALAAFPLIELEVRHRGSFGSFPFSIIPFSELANLAVEVLFHGVVEGVHVPSLAN